jgi:hypothetical protein
MANGLHGKNLAQSETLCTWRSSLRGTWEVSSMPGAVCRAGSGRPSAARRACTWMRSRMRPYYRGSDRTKDGDIQRRSWREGPHPRGTADRRPWFGLCAELPRRSDWRLYAELRAGPHRLLADVRPEGGARCVSSARRDLCGGRGVILVPTATFGRLSAVAAHESIRWETAAPIALRRL